MGVTWTKETISNSGTSGVSSIDSLTIDDIKIDGANIGHVDDTDLLALSSALLTVTGKVTATAGVQLGNNIIYASDGGTTITLDTSDNVTITNTLTIGGGNIAAGQNSTTRGTLSLWDGNGGNQPGYLVLYSPNGTANYIFCEDDGTLKRHTSTPSANGDGSIVGQQS